MDVVATVPVPRCRTLSRPIDVVAMAQGWRHWFLVRACHCLSSVSLSQSTYEQRYLRGNLDMSMLPGSHRANIKPLSTVWRRPNICFHFGNGLRHGRSTGSSLSISIAALNCLSRLGRRNCDANWQGNRARFFRRQLAVRNGVRFATIRRALR